MKKIVADRNAIGACGLYCGGCRKYRKEKCLGCHNNEKATWCKIRKCCIDKGILTCAECDCDVKHCHIHNNFIGKLFSLLFNSNRAACISFIKQYGEQAFAEKMTKHGMMTIKRQKR